MKRVLLDQGLAPHAATILCERGFDAIHVAEIGLDRAEDVLILEKARQDGRVCITLDHDFHAHLALTGQSGPSVLFLRAQGLDARNQANLVQAVLEQCADLLGDGAAISTDGDKIRIRRLPLR